MDQESHDKRISHYTNLPLEIFVFALTVLPFLLLAYFYSTLPDRVPLFMKLNGEVAEWGQKSVLSVFRVPLLAVIMQIVCFLMKYEMVQAHAAVVSTDHSKLQERYLSLSSGMWDWFRWTIAVKMSAESLHTVFLTTPRYNSLSQPTFLVTAIVALFGAAGALLYLYRLLLVARELKKQFPNVSKYRFNFANPRLWALIACAIAYPLLVFLPG